MLRLFLIAISLTLTLAGVVSYLSGTKGALPLLGWGLVLLVATVFEQWRYRQRHTDLGPGWVRTDECFEDPSTGKIMRVWYHAESGQRQYVPEANQP